MLHLLALGFVSQAATAVHVHDRHLPSARLCDDAVLLTFRPKEGSVVGGTLIQTGRTSLVSESGCSIVDGERLEDEAWTSDGGLDSKFELTSRWEDRIGAVDDDGRVLQLEREIEGVSGTSKHTDALGEVLMDAELASPLTGRVVRFAWDDDEGAYDKGFAEDGKSEEVDEVLLGDQRIDIFGAWFLPPEDHGTVEPGEGWELCVERWNESVVMGGDWWIDVEGAAAPSQEVAEEARSYDAQLQENAEGTVECVLVEVRLEEGRRIAEIAVAVKVETMAELSYTEEVDGAQSEVSVQVEDELSAAGSVLWDVDAGRPISLEVRMDMTMTTTEVSTSPYDEGDEVSTVGLEMVVVEESAYVSKILFEQRED